MNQFCNKGHDTLIVGRNTQGYCKVCSRENVKQWRLRNRSKVYLQHRKYCARYPEKRKALVHKWYERNKERIKQKTVEWQKQHPKRLLAILRRMQIKRQKRVPRFGQEGIRQFYENCPKGYHVDHIIPLNGKTVSGLHVIWNLQYLTPSQNSIKGNRYSR